jgi:hypothetical protein
MSALGARRNREALTGSGSATAQARRPGSCSTRSRPRPITAERIAKLVERRAEERAEQLYAERMKLETEAAAAEFQVDAPRGRAGSHPALDVHASPKAVLLLAADVVHRRVVAAYGVCPRPFHATQSNGS